MPCKCLSQKALLIDALAIGLLFASGNADAGGFGVREQSASGLGAAFAGVAAGYDLSSIFWNPAGVSIADGLEAEADGAAVLLDTHIAGSATFEPAAPLDIPLGSSVPLSFLDSKSGGISDPAFVPAMYAGMPVTSRLTVGFGFNGPFGLVTEPDNNNWAGQFEARTSMLRTFNFNPVASYKVAPNLVVGAGAQIEYANATLKSAFPNLAALSTLNVVRAFGGANPNVVIDGDGFGFGYTLGILWNPLRSTNIGLGFRSSVEHTLDGDISVAGHSALGEAKTSVDLETPEIATASLRQKVSGRLTLLGTIEWTDWSTLDQIAVKAHTNNTNFGATAGSPVAVFPLGWHDAWFFSGGAEFAINDRTTVRGGVAYEESPIQNANERTARVPDTNRVWLSLGGAYEWSPTATINVAYSHIFLEDGAIDRTSKFPVGDIRLIGESQNQIDILALSVRIKLGSVPKASPLK
jgi:long-chain fatty acid transport protein